MLSSVLTSGSLGSAGGVERATPHSFWMLGEELSQLATGGSGGSPGDGCFGIGGRSVKVTPHRSWLLEMVSSVLTSDGLGSVDGAERATPHFSWMLGEELSELAKVAGGGGGCGDSIGGGCFGIGGRSVKLTSHWS